MSTRIAIIESHVVDGNVGNRAAQPVLELLGFDVLVIPTVLYTCRVGAPGFAGQETSPELLKDLTGYLTKCDLQATVIGYLGGASGAGVVLDTLGKLSCPLVVDPVMGDYPGGLYVPRGVTDKIIHELIPLAKVVTPNKFEAELISDISISCDSDAIAAAKKIASLGPEIVVITSCHQDSTWAVNYVYSRDRGELQKFPYIESTRTIYGTGDMFTALLTGLLLKDVDVFLASAVAAALVSEALKFSIKTNRDTVQPVLALNKFRSYLQTGQYQAIMKSTNCIRRMISCEP